MFFESVIDASRQSGIFKTYTLDVVGKNEIKVVVTDGSIIRNCKGSEKMDGRNVVLFCFKTQ